MADIDPSLYGMAIRMWIARFDTAWIAKQLQLPEPLIERWIWNYRDMMREVARA